MSEREGGRNRVKESDGDTDRQIDIERARLPFFFFFGSLHDVLH